MTKKIIQKNKFLFNNPILQVFLVKSNLLIDLFNFINYIHVVPSKGDDELSHRSGSIVAIKYKKLIKGREDLFKNKIGFKNACHLIVCYTLEKRKKKLIHIRLTAIGTFHIMGLPQPDVVNIIFKLFLLLEKGNKNNIFQYINPDNTDARLEIVIVPVLSNFMLTFSDELTKRIFSNSKIKIVKKFIDNNFLSFMVPGDHAIIIKKSFTFEDFRTQPILYITWSHKYGKLSRYIEYESYTTLLTGIQHKNALYKKYLTLRLFSTGKVWVSGFNELLIRDEVNKFLKVCEQI